MTTFAARIRPSCIRRRRGATRHRLLAGFAALLVAAPTFAAGLLAPTDRSLPPLRVTDHLVNVEIRNGIALTTLRQTFHNDTNRRLEATYVFPLPEFADLTDFRMTFNGKMVEGEVLPADEARSIYESIVRQAKDPGLIEFIGHRLLQMRVFPIEPGSDTTIEVRYQQICRPMNDMSAYHYPLRTGRTQGRAHGTVRFNVELETNADLKTIWSPSHTVEVVRDGERKARIAYETKGASLEDDFLLLYDTEDGDLGLSVVAHKPNENEPGTFVLLATPKHLWPDEPAQPQDVVFVIDTSGSMSGDKIEQARSAMKYCIDRLEDEDRFGVVRFSTGFDYLAQSLQPATRENRKAALNFVETFNAAGGTNIHDALGAALDLLPDAADVDRPFVMVFLTDGQGDRTPPAIVSMMTKRLDASPQRSIRLFSFGVGEDVNTELLDGLAAALSGRPTYVLPGENLEIALSDFFNVISRPVMTNVRIRLPEIGATEQFPAVIGDLYHGDSIILAGKFRTPAAGPVKVTGERRGEAVEFVWPDVRFEHTEDASYVEPVWAGRKIAALIDRIRIHGETKELVDEVVALGQKHRLQTPFTSWLVAPEHQHLVSRTIRLRSGHGGGRGGGGGGGNIFGDPEDEPDRGAGNQLGAGGSGGRGRAPASARAMRVAEADQLAGLRSIDSIDEARAVGVTLRFEVGDVWYAFQPREGYVDERIPDDATIWSVPFGSEAYFELVLARADLRPVFATSLEVTVLATPAIAIRITPESDADGIQAFSDDQRKQIGLPTR